MQLRLVTASAAALSLLVLGPVAQAADTPPPSAPSTAPHPPGQQPKDDDRIICKPQMATGSRLPAKKVCHSKREWDEVSAQTQQYLQSDPHQQNPTDDAGGLMAPPKIKCCAAG